jgi:hypothetical protein
MFLLLLLFFVVVAVGVGNFFIFMALNLAQP